MSKFDLSPEHQYALEQARVHLVKIAKDLDEPVQLLVEPFWFHDKNGEYQSYTQTFTFPKRESIPEEKSE